MKTAVDTIFVGKDRQYNRRFLQMCSHHLVDPVACTPASGWEKGQVENQVGLVRERFFTPRLRVKTYDELNAWLTDKCVAYAKVHPHPERPDQTVWEVFEEEPQRADASFRLRSSIAQRPGLPVRLGLRKITHHFLVPCQSATPAPRDSSPRIRAFLLTRAKFSPHERSCRRPRGDTQLLRFSAILVSAFYPPGHCYAEVRS
jgi:hypothetical protein